MTLDKQISHLEMLEKKKSIGLEPVINTLKQLNGLFNEPDRDVRAHLYFFMRQELTGLSGPVNFERKIEEVVDPKLTIGQEFYYANTKLKYVLTRGIDIIAMDESGSERSIPKTQWNKIIPTK